MDYNHGNKRLALEKGLHYKSVDQFSLMEALEKGLHHKSLDLSSIMEAITEIFFDQQQIRRASVLKWDGEQKSIGLALENALRDECRDPTALPLWFLRDITENFSHDQEIGRGGFGVVYKGELSDGTVAAKKLLETITIQEKQFDSEVRCLIGLKHKNIVRFLGYCSETQYEMQPFNGELVWAEVRQRLLCFEYLSRGSLASYLTGPWLGLPWSTRYQIIKGLCEGLYYLHEKRIVHMDLKPQNVLMDDNMIPKIADFGLSRRLSENQNQHITKEICGSLGYMAPEFLHKSEITFKTDIYSLGIIIIEILMGCKGCPEVGEVLETWTNIVGTLDSDKPLEKIKVCAEIGIECTDIDKQNRPTACDIMRRLDEMEMSNWHASSTASVGKINIRVPESKSVSVAPSPLPLATNRGSNSVGYTPTEGTNQRFQLLEETMNGFSEEQILDRGANLKNKYRCVWFPDLHRVYVVLHGQTNVFQSSEGDTPPGQLRVCAEIGIECAHKDDPEIRPPTSSVIGMLDEAEISNWSAVGQMSSVLELMDEVKSMVLSRAPFQPKRISSLKGSAGTSTKISTRSTEDEPSLNVHPLELRFPFRANVPIDCSLSITNRTNRYVGFWTIPHVPDMYLPSDLLNGVLMPMSTCGVIVTMVEQYKAPDDMGMLEILMVSMERESDLTCLMSNIVEEPTLAGDLLRLVEVLGGEVHWAMLKTVVCPPSEIANPIVISTREFLGVRSVDVHPTVPWILLTYKSSHLCIWNYENKGIVMELEVGREAGLFYNLMHKQVDVYTSIFIPVKNCFAAGDSCGYIHIYSCDTMKEIRRFKAHHNTVVSLAIYPSNSLLPSSDHAGVIKLWDGEMDWICSRTFEGGYSLSQVKFNPRDSDTFAGTEQCGVVKVWSIDSSDPDIITEEERSSVCSYLSTNSRQYLVTTSLDDLVNVWDLKTKTRVHTFFLDSREYITVMACHPVLPLVVTGSMESNQPTICFWSSAAYRLEKMIHCALECKIEGLEFVGLRRLVIRYRDRIEVLEIDVETLAATTL
ncbi:hypothetical protein ACQJBY_003988 [Aegilops geniculata]